MTANKTQRAQRERLINRLLITSSFVASGTALGLSLLGVSAVHADNSETELPQSKAAILETIDTSLVRQEIHKSGNAVMFRTEQGVFCIAVPTHGKGNFELDCNWDYFNELNRNKMTGQWYNGVSPYLPKPNH